MDDKSNKNKDSNVIRHQEAKASANLPVRADSLFTSFCNAIKSHFDFHLKRQYEMTDKSNEYADIIDDCLEKMTTATSNSSSTADTSSSEGQQEQEQEEQQPQPQEQEVHANSKKLGLILLQGSEKQLASKLKTLAQNGVKIQSHVFLDDQEKCDIVIGQMMALSENKIQIQRQMESKHDAFEKMRLKHIKQRDLEEDET